jgi:hypothetical protein
MPAYIKYSEKEGQRSGYIGVFSRNDITLIVSKWGNAEVVGSRVYVDAAAMQTHSVLLAFRVI